MENDHLTNSKADTSFDPYSLLKQGTGYTLDSVENVIRRYISIIQSLQSQRDMYRSELDNMSKSLANSEYNNDILKSSADSAIPQMFSSKKAMNDLAFKDRPAGLIGSNEVFVYDAETKRWTEADNAECK